MPDGLQSATDLADAIGRVADRAASEMELQIEIEKLLDPFLPKIPGVTLDHYGHATKLGGYQVCEKWLKDRKGRKLSSDEIDHYQKIIAALNETIRIMREIDVAIPEWPIA